MTHPADNPRSFRHPGIFKFKEMRKECQIKNAGITKMQIVAIKLFYLWRETTKLHVSYQDQNGRYVGFSIRYTYVNGNFRVGLSRCRRILSN